MSIATPSLTTQEVKKLAADWYHKLDVHAPLVELLPMVAEDYVHRVGRTGRAGVPGNAVSLVTADEKPLLHEIQKLLSARLEHAVVDGFGGSEMRAHPVQPRENRQKHQRREFVPDRHRRHSGRKGARRANYGASVHRMDAPSEEALRLSRAARR